MNRWNALRELALITWVSGCVLTAAHADVVKLGDVVEPKDCGNGFDYVPATKSCKAIDATIATFDENQCQGAALNWDKDSKKCSANAKAPPKPQCGDKIPDLTLKDGECVVERKVPSSSPGDYVGDCLRISASPTSDIMSFVPSRYLKVQSQGIRNGDKVLRVVPASPDKWFGAARRRTPPTRKCLPALWKTLACSAPAGPMAC